MSYKNKYGGYDDSADYSNNSDEYSADYIGEGEPDNAEDVVLKSEEESVDSTEGLVNESDDDSEPAAENSEEDVVVDIDEEPIEEEVNLKDVSIYNKEIIIINPTKRQTSDILSRYEMTEIISIRSTQIAQFNNPMVDSTGLSNPVDIAKRELMNRMCPLMLRRMVGELKNEKTGILELYAEDWCPNEMIFATAYEC